MERKSRIFVAGHRGLAGAAIVRCLEEQGYSSIIRRTHEELDLMDQRAAREFFQRERPEYVFLAAARVGGIGANSKCPAHFIHDNLLIQDNVIHESWRTGVRRLMFLGSSCIYPRECPQPIREKYLLTGPLEPTNRPYAVAKIAGIEECRAYNRQYGTEFMAVMPTNLYGPGDNFDLETSHVIPAIIRKMHEAKQEGRTHVTLWGTGRPRREFVHSRDMAEACVFLMNLNSDRLKCILNPEDAPIVNVGCGNDLSIRELAEVIRKIVKFKGTVHWDASMPDGTPRKLLDVSLLFSLGWRPKIGLEEGIVEAYQDFLENQ